MFDHNFIFPLKPSIANPMFSFTTVLQENHLKKRNIRKVKDATTSQVSETISMVHGKFKTNISFFSFLFFLFFFFFWLVEFNHLLLFSSFFQKMFIHHSFPSKFLFSFTRMFQESTSMSHLNQVHSVTLSFNMYFCLFSFPLILFSSFLGPC